ncbi:hypothetical protein IFR05_014259 [Cadophora sp. M221]|nr:hypothetical protein IFR05_014259 [Cadophora sp. M221]
MSTRSGQRSSGKSGQKSSGKSGHKSSGKSGQSSKGSSKGSKHHPKPQQQLHLYIAVYTPSSGHYYHWAITIFDEATGEWHTYEVIRSYESGPFATHYLEADPRSSTRCQPLVYLAGRPSTSLDTIIGIITGVLVQADPRWDCQSYVVDIMNALERENLVTEEEHQAAWGQVTGFYGYMEQDFGAQQPAADDERILSDEYAYDSSDE